MATIEEIRKDLKWPDDGGAFADAPRWVTTRMKCYLPRILADLLALITRDVVEFNDLPAFLRHDRKFDVELGNRLGDPPPSFEIHRIEPTPKAKVVTLEDRGNSIAVTRANGDVETIHLKWDAQAIACHLLLNKRRVEAWEISQQILDPLFCGHETDS
ncbi:MAG: hypothetical protein OXU75_12810 [Deltaproteobacteria bacterium]|nr:hypothetical protein [Deltaproteobacteria bacterium]